MHAATARRASAVKAAVAVAVVVGLGGGAAYAIANRERSFDYGKHAFDVKKAMAVLQQTPCDTDAFVTLIDLMKDSGDAKGVEQRTAAWTAGGCGELPWAPWLTYDYAGKASEVKGLVEAMRREPCDRQKLIKLLDKMVGAGDHRGTLQRADMFFAKCGDFPRARWLTFEAHKRLSEFDQAAGEATKLIEADRYDRDYWWWRGDAWFLKGDYEKAIADYKEVAKLCPECTVRWRLADAYEKVGRPCEGIEPLAQAVARNPDANDIGKVEARLAALRADPACGGAPPPAAAEPAPPPKKGGAAGMPRKGR
jgi:tetratricopeptide (TPR) repeat protein